MPSTDRTSPCGAARRAAAASTRSRVSAQLGVRPDQVGRARRSRTTRPRSTMATRSQTSSISLSRCELRKTATPSARRRANDVAHLAAADRVERRGRLVEQYQVGLGEDRLGQPDALGHAFRVAAQPVAAAPGQADALEHGGDARAALGGRQAGQAAVEVEQRVAGQPVVEAEVLGQVADRGGGPPARRRAGRRCAPRRRSARTSPVRILIVVVLPAPFGPRKPKTSPGWTASDRSCRATLRPYSLRRPTSRRPARRPVAASAAGRSAEAVGDTLDLGGPRRRRPRRRCGRRAARWRALPTPLLSASRRPARPAIVVCCQAIWSTGHGDRQRGPPVLDGAQLAHRLGRQARQPQQELA